MDYDNSLIYTTESGFGRRGQDSDDQSDDRFDDAFDDRSGGRPGEIIARRAVIEDINFERGTVFVTIIYRDNRGPGRGRTQTVTLVVTRETRIRDERGRNISPRDLEEGMVINATFSERMTRSIPPQAQAFRIRVLEREARNQVTEGRIIEVNTRNQFILVRSSGGLASIIRFNISQNTIIRDSFGRRIPLRTLFPGLRVRVEHASFMTASIPPQTTAFVIEVLRR